eukprot:754457-Hanusia_phi.AAC.5
MAEAENNDVQDVSLCVVEPLARQALDMATECTAMDTIVMADMEASACMIWCLRLSSWLLGYGSSYGGGYGSMYGGMSRYGGMGGYGNRPHEAFLSDLQTGMGSRYGMGGMG